MTNIPARCGDPRCCDLPRSFLANLDPPDRFTSKEDALGIQGRVVSDYGQIIHGLLDESSLQLEVFCSVDSETASNNTRAGRVLMKHHCTLSITVYGPLELFDEIGTWFQEYELYLQDPTRVGELDVRYCNPHRLSSNDLSSCVLISEFIAQNSTLFGFEEFVGQPDLLDILSSHADLEEAPQPTAIHTTLKR